MIKMELLSVAVVEDGGSNVVVLREKEAERVLVIGIGLAEASAIALELEQVSTPRPMTHDLLLGIVSRLRGEVVRVSIHEVKEDVFYGQIDLQTEDGVLEVDARPSDAIALAVRAGAPIYASEQVLDQAAFIPEGDSWLAGGKSEDEEDE